MIAGKVYIDPITPRTSSGSDRRFSWHIVVVVYADGLVGAEVLLVGGVVVVVVALCGLGLDIGCDVSKPLYPIREGVRVWAVYALSV